MRASEESTEQRLGRWQKLRDYGLHKKPPDDLLLEPEPATRPNVRLVAYYDKIKQESTGKKTITEILTAVLAVVLGVRVLTGFDRWFDDSEQPVTLGWLILTLVLLAVTCMAAWVFLRKMGSRKDSLSLNWEELSLSLPNGNRHVPWRDVYSAIDIQRRKRFSRRKPYVRRAVSTESRFPARGRPIWPTGRTLAAQFATCGRGLAPLLHGIQYPLAFLKRELEHHRADRLPVHFDQGVRQHGKVADIHPVQCGQVAVAVSPMY